MAKKIIKINLTNEEFAGVKGETLLDIRRKGPYWRSRLVGREYDEVHLIRGLKSSEKIVRRWKQVTQDGWWFVVDARKSVSRTAGKNHIFISDPDKKTRTTNPKEQALEEGIRRRRIEAIQEERELREMIGDVW